MKQSRLFLTAKRGAQRGNSAKADLVSNKLMLHAGLIRQLTPGIYTWLPFGTRILQKIEAVVRREMDGAGAQEVLLPALQPETLWLQSGHRSALGPLLFSLTDGQQQSLVLGATHEEAIANLVRNEVHDGRQFPLTLYQIQTRFLDEQQTQGLLYNREFRMKDAYSFDVDDKDHNQSYQAVYQAYSRIFERLGIEYRTVAVDAQSTEGESGSHIFIVLCDGGEDTIVECPHCGYAAYNGFATTNQTGCDIDAIIGRGLLMDSTDSSRRAIPEDDSCPKCHSALRVAKGIAVGHLCKLDTHDSSRLDARYLDEDGQSVHLRLGYYALGTTRLLQAIVEQCHDDNGMIWPLHAAPYKVHLVPVNMRDEEQVKVSHVLYQRFQAADVEILFDDRDERAGVKFQDADLLGLPVRLTVGTQIREGEVEIYLRATGETQTLPVDQAFHKILNLVK